MDLQNQLLWRERLDQVLSNPANSPTLGSLLVLLMRMSVTPGVSSRQVEDQRTTAARTWGHHLTAGWLDPWLAEYRRLNSGARADFEQWLMAGAEVSSG